VLKQIWPIPAASMIRAKPVLNISEHAFGNALDIAAFVLADGHRHPVKGGWNGRRRKQAFSATWRPRLRRSSPLCWPPGSTSSTTDHIHVD
jgi:hypothetical protein